MNSPRTYVLVLNWNGWADTVSCLESLWRGDAAQQRIVVWDNGSTDKSAERIADWAAENLPPATCELIEPGQSDTGRPLVILRGGENLGYAGGNNAALRWALGHADCDFVWILNNDTRVAAEAGAQMRATALADPYDRPVGAAIYYMDDPERLQTCGGQRLGRGPLVAPRYVDCIESVDYLTGVSLFMSRKRAEALGFFNEDYFLNAEDLEYTYAYKRAFVAAHPGEAAFRVAGLVWHRESTTQSRNRFLHTYYFTRNLLYAARRISRLHAAVTLGHAVARVGLAALRAQRADLRGISAGIRDYRAGVVGAYRGAA